MIYGLNLGWGGPIGDCWILGGPTKGYTTNLVQGPNHVEIILLYSLLATSTLYN